MAKYAVGKDRDGWFRIYRNGRLIRAAKVPWNLYRTEGEAVRIVEKLKILDK